MKHFIMKTITALLIAAVMPITAFAEDTKSPARLEGIPSGEYVMDNTHASLVWKINHFGLSNYTARFGQFDAKLDFDAQNPQNSSLSVTINPLSIKTGHPEDHKTDFDAKLSLGEAWFNGNKFPEITFEATGITKTGADTGTITGDLSMLGISKPVSFNVTLNGAFTKHPIAGDAALGFSGHGVLNRSEWGITNYIPNLADEVEFFIEVEFHKAK